MKARPGFSLIEIMVVMAIIAAGILFAVPLFNNLAGIKLKQESTELVRTLRVTYSKAALSGQTHRIAFEMKVDKETNVETTAYWVESSKEEARAAELVKEEEGNGLWVGTEDREKQEKEKYRKKPSFTPIKEKTGKFGLRHELKAPVKIYGAWVEGMKDRLREGTVYLYFSPMGYSQRAQISLTDDPQGKNVMVLITDPLTGEVTVENEEKPIR